MGSLRPSKSPKRPVFRLDAETSDGTSEVNASERSTKTPHPSYKRRRIALACTSCRNRKSRCNGARPVCELCLQLGFDCVYQQPIPGNTLTLPLDYDNRLQALEKTVRLLVHGQNEIADDGANSPRRRATVDLERTEELLANQDVATLNEGGRLEQNTPEDAVDGMATITDAEEAESMFFGPSSNVSFLRHISDAICATFETIGAARQQDPNISSQLVSRAASPIQSLSETSPMEHRAINIVSLPQESHALRLIGLFFSDTGMLFPYVDEEEILRSYAAAKCRGFSQVSRSWLCLLNVIFAFATYVSARPDQTAEKSAVESEVFFRRAQALLAEIDMMKATNVQTVQCLLLMSQYRQGTQKSDQTWHLHSLAVRAATQLGLHSRSALARLTTRQAEVRKRTWFGCIILDRTLSMTFGRPPIIPNDYITMDLPTKQNLRQLACTTRTMTPSHGVTQPDTVCLFISTIDLYIVQAEIIKDLYGQNLEPSSPSLTVPEMLAKIIPFEGKLASWRRDLFPQLQRRPWESVPICSSLSIPSPNSVFDRLSVIMRLRYLNTRILLHRPILDAGLRQRALINTETVYQEDEAFTSQLGQGSIKICETSAVEIVTIVHTMSKPPSLLGAWWFSTYYTFNAALVIFSCLLFKLARHQQDTGAESSPADTIDSRLIIDLLTRLRTACGALQRLGEGTRSAKRVRKTLLKLQQISLALVQSNSDLGPAVLLALSAIDGAHSSQLHQETFPSLERRDDNNVHQDITADALAAPSLEPNDLFSSLDVRIDWAESDFDLFADLGGVDLGWSALTAA